MRRSITRDLETADAIAKLILSIATILLFLAGVIGGPFAVALVVLSVLVLFLYLIKAIYRRRFQDRSPNNGEEDGGPETGRAD
ncbi:MAG: hypothetical protein M3Y60_14720 [Bacteroidota bacterium]|nr:hypothetical protein [Bacteroidota bacterium]